MFFLSLQCLKRLAEYVNEQNQSVFVPRGLMIVNPMERGLRVVSFHEFYLVFTASITTEFLLTWSPIGSCPHTLYSYFEKGCGKKINVHMAIPKGNMIYDPYTVSDTVAVEPTFVAFLKHSQTYVYFLSCHSFKFPWRTVNSKPPTIPLRIVACTFSDNPSQNICIVKKMLCKIGQKLPFSTTSLRYLLSLWDNIF